MHSLRVFHRSRRPALLAALAVAAVVAQQTHAPSAAPATAAHAAPAHPPAKSVNNYVDPQLCATCHAEIAETYAKTGMGRSFSKITPQTPGDPFPAGKPFYHEASASYFSMVRHDGKIYQRRWQIGYDGKETNIEEKSADYVLGSGNHGRTYLHLTARNGLQQLPMGWYSEDGEIYLDRFFGDPNQQLPANWYSGSGGGIWAMIPGYDRADYPGSERPVHYECMFCHNGYPKIPKANEEEGAEAVYQLPLPNGIDCQRCHGPGQRHIETVSKAGVTPAEIQASIVNPKRLSPERELEVCLQCHLETSSLKLPHAVQRLGRLPFSYVPGQPLENFMIAFDREPGRNQRFEVANAAYALRRSQCFLKTQGNDAAHQLRCTSCHDPHNIPRGAEATAHYNSVCRTCHTETFAAAVTAGTHPSNPDCVSCHMPKHRTDDAIHIVMTDHFIRARPPANLLARKTEYYESPATSYKGEVIPYYPAKLPPTPANLLDVASAQVVDGSNLRQGIPRLLELIRKYRPTQAAYYATLAEGLHMSGDPAGSSQYFAEALRRAPDSTVIMIKLAIAQTDWQAWPAAEATARRVIALTPSDPVAWGLLGQALYEQNKSEAAREALNKALSFDPDLPEPHNYLAAMLVRAGDLDGAEKEFRAALRILPANAEWQANLAGLLASRGSVAEAKFLFELAIRLKPEATAARLNYAKMLANTNQTAEAAEQARAAVLADPGVPEAHELWGSLLSLQNDLDGAVRELKTAVDLRPDFWRAQYELGVALGMQGDNTGAAAHLRLAAQGNDPEAKSAAEDTLRKLSR